MQKHISKSKQKTINNIYDKFVGANFVRPQFEKNIKNKNVGASSARPCKEAKKYEI